MSHLSEREYRLDVIELAEILVRSAELEREFFFATEYGLYIVRDFVEAMEKALSMGAFKISIPAWLARILAPDPLRKHWHSSIGFPHTTRC